MFVTIGKKEVFDYLSTKKSFSLAKKKNFHPFFKFSMVKLNVFVNKSQSSYLYGLKKFGDTLPKVFQPI